MRKYKVEVSLSGGGIVEVIAENEEQAKRKACWDAPDNAIVTRLVILESQEVTEGGNGND